MTTLMAFHEIDDSAHWLASSKRSELFGAIGVQHRTFIDPENPNRAGVLLEIPDMDAFQALMQSEAAVEAMKHDGVRAETLVLLVEA